MAGGILATVLWGALVLLGREAQALSTALIFADIGGGVLVAAVAALLPAQPRGYGRGQFGFHWLAGGGYFLLPP